MLFPSSPERRHGQRRKALWKGKQYGKSIWVPPRSATTIQGFDRNSASALHIPVCITASNGVRPCRKKPYGPSATKKALLGGEPCAFRVLERGSRVEDQGDEFEIFSTVVLQHVLLAVFADHHVTGGYCFSSPLSKYRPVPLRTWYTSKSPTMAMPADGTAGFEHAMVENAALTREIFAVEQFRGEDMPFAAFVLHVQFGQFIIMPYHENAPFGP